jgi:LysM repeat protein
MRTILAEINAVVIELEDKGFHKAAASLNDIFVRLAQANIHTVSTGESPSRIANDYNISLAQLIAANAANPQVANALRSGKIYGGLKLALPMGIKAKVEPPMVVEVGFSKNWRGETVPADYAKIAKMYNVSEQELRKINGNKKLDLYAKVTIPRK